MNKKSLIICINFVLFVLFFIFASLLNRKLSFTAGLLNNISISLMLLIPFLIGIWRGSRDLETQPSKVLYKIPISVFIVGLLLTIVYFVFIYFMEANSPGAFTSTGSLIFIIPVMGIIISFFLGLFSFIIALIIKFLYKK